MSAQASSSVPAAGTSQQAAATSANNAVNAAVQAEEASGTYSSLSDLQQQAPEVYQAMMQGIAMNICNDMEQEQAHLQQIQEEFRQEEEDS